MDNFWDGRKYEQPTENSSRLCGLDFYKMISKGDFEEMRWRRDYLKLPKKTLGGFLWFFFVTILGDHSGVFGRRWKRSCGNEVCRSLSWRKYKNNPLCNVLRKAEYLILELGMMVEKKEWWKILEVSKTSNNSSQEFMFVFCLYLDFVVLFYKNEYLNFGNSKGLQQSIEFTRSIT